MGCSYRGNFFGCWHSTIFGSGSLAVPRRDFTNFLSAGDFFFKYSEQLTLSYFKGEISMKMKLDKLLGLIGTECDLLVEVEDSELLATISNLLGFVLPSKEVAELSSEHPYYAGVFVHQTNRTIKYRSGSDLFDNSEDAALHYLRDKKSRGGNSEYFGVYRTGRVWRVQINIQGVPTSGHRSFSTEREAGLAASRLLKAGKI